jgi:hypothetical protein
LFQRAFVVAAGDAVGGELVAGLAVGWVGREARAQLGLRAGTGEDVGEAQLAATPNLGPWQSRVLTPADDGCDGFFIAQSSRL